jgi:hypothetical protein
MRNPSLNSLRLIRTSILCDKRRSEFGCFAKIASASGPKQAVDHFDKLFIFRFHRLFPFKVNLSLGCLISLTTSRAIIAAMSRKNGTALESTPCPAVLGANVRIVAVAGDTCSYLSWNRSLSFPRLLDGFLNFRTRLMCDYLRPWNTKVFVLDSGTPLLLVPLSVLAPLGRGFPLVYIYLFYIYIYGP